VIRVRGEHASDVVVSSPPTAPLATQDVSKEDLWIIRGSIGSAV